MQGEGKSSKKNGGKSQESRANKSTGQKAQRDNEKQKQLKDVKGFEGYYNFLSNDFPTWVYYQGMLYPSVLTAFQAARTQDSNLRSKIANVTDVQEFRNLAISIRNPQNWIDCKYQVMQTLVRDKFKRNKQLASKLLATKNKKLINVLTTSGYNERFWGVVEDRGSNALGKILMNIRQEFNQGTDTKNWILNSLSLQKNENLYPKLSLVISKDEQKIDKLFLENKAYFLFGNLKNCDFILQNPTISRSHAVVYFADDLTVMLADLNSTHGTFVKSKHKDEKTQLEALLAVAIDEGDVVSFGKSERCYTVGIDRQGVEKYIEETQQKLKMELQEVQLKNEQLGNYENISKSEIKELLGIGNRCLLVSGIREDASYHTIREQFQAFGKVKRLRTKIDRSSGRFLGSAIVYFQREEGLIDALKNQSEVTYQLKSISEKEADNYLGPVQEGQKQSKKRSGSSSPSRSRSRDKARTRKH